MSELIERMSAAGCEIDMTMERFMEDRELYNECVRMALEDNSFAALGSALESQSTQEAFEAAHALKGITANVGLLPLYDIITGIVEQLRVGIVDGLMPQYAALMAKRQELEDISKND